MTEKTVIEGIDVDLDDDIDDDDPDVVELPGGRGGGLPKFVIVLVLILVVFGVLVVGGRDWYRRQVDPPGPPGERVDVLVPNGARLTDLGSLLGDADVVSNGTIFRLWIRNEDIDLQAGTYRFQRHSSFEEVADVLREGPLVAATFDVTVPEGLTVTEIVDAIDERVPRFSPETIRAAVDDPANRSRFLPADQSSMEGMLFPSTYEVSAFDSPTVLIRRMVDEMDRQAVQAGIDEGLTGDHLPSLTAYEVLIVASLIERETGNREESSKIARVIYNRMLEGMPLGIDATSRYIAELTGEPVDFTIDSPYNTRVDVGLPPTPIAAPGRASIDAALSPATGDWLYYVLEAEDRHFFTASNDEFLAAKARCEEQGLGCGQ